MPTSLLFAATLGAMVAAAQIEGAEIERVAREHANLSANLIARTVAGDVAESPLETQPGRAGRDARSRGTAPLEPDRRESASSAPPATVQLSTREDWLRERPWPADRARGHPRGRPRGVCRAPAGARAALPHCSVEPLVGGLARSALLPCRSPAGAPPTGVDLDPPRGPLLARPARDRLVAARAGRPPGPLHRLIAAMRAAEDGQKEVRGRRGAARRVGRRRARLRFGALGAAQEPRRAGGGLPRPVWSAPTASP